MPPSHMRDMSFSLTNQIADILYVDDNDINIKMSLESIFKSLLTIFSFKIGHKSLQRGKSDPRRNKLKNLNNDFLA